MEMTPADLAYIHRALMPRDADGMTCDTIMHRLSVRLNDDRSDFTVVQTGGHCTALERALPGGRFLWLTHEDGGTHEIDAGDTVTLGLYDADGEQLGYIKFTAFCDWN